VITPFLLDTAPEALEYTRALIDFIILAQYRSHDENTLGYMEQALLRIDNTKEAFAKYRPTDANNDAHWNYPKFHSLSHYVSFIRKFGAPNGYDTEHMEPGHKFLVKDFYTRTNKNDGYLRQIASHNTRDTNRKAMDHCLLHFFATTDQEGVEVDIQVTTMSNTPLLVTKYGCRVLSTNTAMKLRSLRLDLKTTTTASEAAKATGLKGFLQALALFVKTSRAELKKEPTNNNERDVCDPDPQWLSEYPVQFFGSVRCWRRTGKDERNSEAQEAEILRCTPDWRSLGERSDWCWVQEYPPSSEESIQEESHGYNRVLNALENNPLNGQQVGQLRVLIKVIDIGYSNNHYKAEPPAYCACLVDIYPFKNYGKPDPVHGMIEVTRPIVHTVNRPRVLKGRRFYGLKSIIRSAHVIPADYYVEPKSTDTFFINNYIDWDQYQVLFEEDWEEKGRERARKIKLQFERAKDSARRVLV
jgi:hypothetical protein